MEQYEAIVLTEKYKVVMGEAAFAINDLTRKMRIAITALEYYLDCPDPIEASAALSAIFERQEREH